MLYRLMSRAVFAVAHRVMCKNENGGQFHQSRQSDRRPRVVAKNEEGCSIRAQLGHRESVYNRTHCMLTDAEMEILTAQIIGLEVSRAVIVEDGLVRWAKIG